MHKMMTAEEVIKTLFSEPMYKGGINFTFDDVEKYPEYVPEGWHGIKLMDIFDEYYSLLAIGYYGGCTTVVYNIENFIDESFEMDEIIGCVKVLQEYMNTWGYAGCEKVCVEIEEG